MQPVPDLPSQQISEQATKTRESLAPPPFVDRSFQAAGFVRLKIGQIGQPHERTSTAANGTGLYLPGIQLVITETAEIAFDLAAQEVLELFRQAGPRGLGTATGGTMGPIWERILNGIPEHTDLSELFTVGLDEYVGVSPQSAQSYRYEMRERLAPLQRYGFDLDNMHLPETWDIVNQQSKSPHMLLSECRQYEQTVRACPPQLQLLGIGSDGHIGFSMPWSDLEQGTHVSQLSAATRNDNARFWAGDIDAVPTRAITMGLETLGAMADGGTRLLLIATGEQKAAAIRDALCGKVWSGCPASLLRLMPNVTFIIDRSAAGCLFAGLLGDDATVGRRQIG